MLDVALYRTSVGLFVAAAALAVGGVLTFAWPSVPSATLWLIGAGLGLFGLVTGAAYAVTSRPPDRWWRALAIGAALLAVSYAAVPAASALSSLTFFWAHRAEADRVAAILLSAEDASGTATGARCRGLAQAECVALVGSLRDLGSTAASGGSARNGPLVHIWLRGDYSAVKCGPSGSCGHGWSIPAGGGWRLVLF